MYASRNIIRIVKPRGTRCAGNVTYGREEVHTEFWWGDLLERDPLENLHVNERIILK